jgi:outer membrane protein TolC
MVIKQFYSNVLPLCTLVLINIAYCNDSLNFALDTYISSVLQENVQIKIDTFKVTLSKLEKENAFRESAPSLKLGYDRKISSQLSTELVDSGRTVENTSNSLTATVSKTFFTGTTISSSWGYKLNYDNSRRIAENLQRHHTTYVNMSMSQSLIKGFMNAIKRRSAHLSEFDYFVKVNEHNRMIISIVVSAIENYFNLLQIQNQLNVTRVMIDDISGLIGIETQLIKKGLSNSDKLFQLETQLLEKENEIFSLEKNHQDKASVFMDLINRNKESFEIICTEEPLIPSIDTTDHVTDSLLRQIYEKRSDLLVLQQHVKKAKMNYEIQKNELLPQLDLNSNYYLYGTDPELDRTFRKMGENDYKSYSVGLQLNVPLGIHVIQKKMMQFSVAVKDAEFQENKLKAGIRDEIVKLTKERQLITKQYMALLNSKETADKHLKKAEELYEKGFISLDELIKNRNNSVTSQIQIFKNRCLYTITMYKLKQAKGLLIEEFGKNSN